MFQQPSCKIDKLYTLHERGQNKTYREMHRSFQQNY